MDEESRRVRLRPRLAEAARLIGRAHIVADIGCDHGRLGVALLQSGAAERVIAADVSAESLEKARALAARTHVAGRMEFRQADGLLALCAGEADAAALCGMGGMLIARLLSAARPKLMGARLAVLQPMRGVEELRRFLYENGYRVTEDVLVPDAGRVYQVFSVAPGRDTFPAGWPTDFFSLGHRALRDAGFVPLAQRMLVLTETSLASAGGTPGEAALVKQAADLAQAIRLAEREGTS